MSAQHPERLARCHRMTRTLDFASIRARGIAYRGRHCLVLALALPGETTRVAFVASRKSVGGAVQRNRARRRLREIVRRRWLRVPPTGYLLMFVALRGILAAPHQELASDVERVLAAAGALAPIAPVED
ncbi:MAG TPA: ribonuclease P protein component [Candidatus Limnocylindria bacterium]|nr:ribonuclease P protein component [Candidatus Limnocylindria bacterium]